MSASVAAAAFADRLDAAVREKRSVLCVGIDPRVDRLPRAVLDAAGGDAGAALERFGAGVIDAVAPFAACVKPNVAFYEAHGLAGLAAYAATLRAARRAGLLAIADVKRGDLGATAEAYARAHLAPGGDFEADAITAHGYMGGDSVSPLVETARTFGKGVFVLVRTSNPGAADLQDAKCAEGGLVYERMAALVARWGEASIGRSGLSSVGAVVGATWPEQARALRAALPHTPFLVPGYGAQGGTAADVVPAFLPGGRGAVVNASRSVTFPDAAPGVSWTEAVAAAARAAREDLHAAVTR